MAIPIRLRQSAVAVLVLVTFVLQGPLAVLAGTTGAIGGTVVDAQSNKPIMGATVSVQSPSQSARTSSDASGRFSFISLAPDTYTVSVAGTSAYDAASVSGVTVQADQTLTVSLQQPAQAQGDRCGERARGVSARQSGHDRRRLLDQCRHARQSVRGGWRRFAQ